MTLRLLHLADLHLDTPVGGRTPEIRARVRGALHDAFRRGVELALEEQVHAVLIAGDAFDDALFSDASANLMRTELTRLAEAGTHVAWCTGNHDPGAHKVGSRRGRAALLGLDDPQRWGHPRIHVFRDQHPGTVLLQDPGGETVGTLTSIGHQTDRDTENLALKLQRPSGPLPAVAMLHTQVHGVRGAAEHERYAPCSSADLKAAGFDYWALGHVHVRGSVPGAPAWYSGNPQGRNPKETGSRGGLLAKLTAGAAPQVTPVDLGPLRFETLHVDNLETIQHIDGLAARLRDALMALRSSTQDITLQCILRVELVGPSPLASLLRRDEERQEAERSLALELDLVDCELRITRLTAPIDLEAFHGTESALREAYRLLATAAGNDTLALELGDVELSPLAPAPGEAGRAAYLAELLNGSADELLLRAFRGAPQK